MKLPLEKGWRQREPRRAVVIPCRMQAGTVWVDVVLHNLSSRGCMVRADDAPAPGTYVDIRRGSRVIIGRVVFRKDGFFGVRSQDRIDINAVINEPRLATRPQASAATIAVDRRAASRLSADAAVARGLERSRSLSAAMQFGLITIGSGVLAVFAATQVYEVLARPLLAVEVHLPGE